MIEDKSFGEGGFLLYLIATPIGNLGEFTPRAIETIQDMDYIAAEDTRNSGSLLKRFGLSKPLIACHEHNEEEASQKIISLIRNGEKVAYMSDAGFPLISDPGARLARKCLENGIKVTTINGPSAFLPALLGSGFDISHFLFYGFLSPKSSARKKELRSLALLPYPIVFYEAPHRVLETLKDIREVLGNRQASLARELTKIHEEFRRGTIEELIESVREGIKGEIVLVVEKPIAQEHEILDSDIEEALLELLKDHSSKEAISRVSSELGIPKKRAYSAYLRLKS